MGHISIVCCDKQGSESEEYSTSIHCFGDVSAKERGIVIVITRDVLFVAYSARHHKCPKNYNSKSVCTCGIVFLLTTCNK